MDDERKEKEQKTFLRVKDVMELCDISESRAYSHSTSPAHYPLLLTHYPLLEPGVIHSAGGRSRK